MSFTKKYKKLCIFFRDLKNVLDPANRLNRKNHMLSEAYKGKVLILAADIMGNPLLRKKGIKIATANNVSRHEMNYLLQGIPGRRKGKDMTALLYAQHWMQKQGIPDQDFREEVMHMYGAPFLHQTENLLYRYRFLHYFTGFLPWGKKSQMPVPGKNGHPRKPQKNHSMENKAIKTLE